MRVYLSCFLSFFHILFHLMSFLPACPDFFLLGLVFPHLYLPSPPLLSSVSHGQMRHACEPLCSCFCCFCSPLNQACLLRLGSTSVCSVDQSEADCLIDPTRCTADISSRKRSPASLMTSCLYLNVYSIQFYLYGTFYIQNSL